MKRIVILLLAATTITSEPAKLSTIYESQRTQCKNRTLVTALDVNRRAFQEKKSGWSNEKYAYALELLDACVKNPQSRKLEKIGLNLKREALRLSKNMSKQDEIVSFFSLIKDNGRLKSVKQILKRLNQLNAQIAATIAEYGEPLLHLQVEDDYFLKAMPTEREVNPAIETLRITPENLPEILYYHVSTEGLSYKKKQELDTILDYMSQLERKFKEAKRDRISIHQKRVTTSERTKHNLKNCEYVAKLSDNQKLLLQRLETCLFALEKEEKQRWKRNEVFAWYGLFDKCAPLGANYAEHIRRINNYQTHLLEEKICKCTMRRKQIAGGAGANYTSCETWRDTRS